MRERLLDMWQWFVARNLCPCALNAPAWSMRLCGRIDDYAWRSGYWGAVDA